MIEKSIVYSMMLLTRLLVGSMLLDHVVDSILQESRIGYTEREVKRLAKDAVTDIRKDDYNEIWSKPSWYIDHAIDTAFIFLKTRGKI